MKRVALWLENHPVSLAVTATAGGDAVQIVAGRLSQWVSGWPNDAAVRIMVPLVFSGLFLVGLVAVLNWWREVGLVGRAATRGHAWLWVPLAGLAILLVDIFAHGVDVTGLGLLRVAGICVLIGFNEEVHVRGLILRAFTSYGRRPAVIWSSVVFALLHGVNLFMGADPLATAGQIAGAFMVGMGLACIRLQTNSVWPAILLHALADFLSFVRLGGYSKLTAVPGLDFVAIWVAISVVFLVYSLLTLREGVGDAADVARSAHPRPTVQP